VGADAVREIPRLPSCRAHADDLAGHPRLAVTGGVCPGADRGAGIHIRAGDARTGAGGRLASGADGADGALRPVAGEQRHGYHPLEGHPVCDCAARAVLDAAARLAHGGRVAAFPARRGAGGGIAGGGGAFPAQRTAGGAADVAGVPAGRAWRVDETGCADRRVSAGAGAWRARRGVFCP